MAYLARKVLSDKHYAIYKDAKTPTKTKARLLKEALMAASKDKGHVEEIDFIPSKFTLQLHGWVGEDSDLKNLTDVEKLIKESLASGKDPLRMLEKHKAATHYDLRVKKNTANTWFGMTPFRSPWEGTITNKVMGTVKGYQSLTPGGEVLQKFLNEDAERSMAKEGIAERRDRTEWLKVKSQWFKPGSPGNPTKKLPAFMVAIEFYKPACIHRRSIDFFDITFFGDHLKGRYYNRLVPRKLKTEELMEWQKKDIRDGKAKEFYKLAFYFWKAKDQWGDKGTPYTMEQVKKAALGKVTLPKIPAPKQKGTIKKK